MSDHVRFMSYKNSSTVVAEAVYQFIHGMVYGAAWSCVTPFPAAGTPAAIKEAATGVFRPVPPFGAIRSLPSTAIYFGAVLGWQRLCSKTLELLRRREDYVNEVFGFAMIYPYYQTFLNHSEKRLVRHNRFVGGAVLCAVFYANCMA